MPASYLIDVRRGVVFTRSCGVFTDREMLARNDALVADARFRPAHAWLSNLLDVTQLALIVTGPLAYGLAPRRAPGRWRGR